MADHLTEEEQLEALKNWWKEYWMSIVLPILVAALGYFGWTTWQTNQEVKAKQGSLLYQEMVNLVGQGNNEISEENRNEAEVIAQQLIDSYGGTLYSDRAKLIKARFAVNEDSLDAAAEQLQDVVDNGANQAIKHLAKSRLARVRIAQGQYDEAVTLMSPPEDDSYKSLFAEIRGDALAAQGEVAAATTAYQEAIDNLGEDFSRRGIIELKQQGAKIVAQVTSSPAKPAEVNTEAKQEAEAVKESQESAESTPVAEPTEQLADEGKS